MPRGQSCNHRQNFHIPDNIASLPGPTQLSVACSTEKQEEPGIFSHEHDIINGEIFRTNSCVLCIVQLTTCSTLGVYDNCPLIRVVSWFEDRQYFPLYGSFLELCRPCRADSTGRGREREGEERGKNRIIKPICTPTLHCTHCSEHDSEGWPNTAAHTIHDPPPTHTCTRPSSRPYPASSRS